MPYFQISAIQAPPAVSAVRPVTAPAPPKVQSDHKPANPATSSRGPAVVLSGALAKAPERQGARASSDVPSATGQHINHVI